jgi:hypothetical protein
MRRFRWGYVLLAGLLVWVIDFFVVLVPPALSWTNDFNAGAFLMLLAIGAVLIGGSVVEMSHQAPRTFRAIGTALFIGETVKHVYRHYHRP